MAGIAIGGTISVHGGQGLRDPSNNMQIVDIIPQSDSAETDQNSEPSLAVDPLDPTQMIAGAFSDNFGTNGLITPYYETTNAGTTWSDCGSLVTADKSLAWLPNGAAVLTATLFENVDGNNSIITYSGTTASSSFGAATNTYNPELLLDQPWIRTGPSDHVYVAYNNLGPLGNLGATGGETASVNVSTDGGSTFTPVTLCNLELPSERRCGQQRRHYRSGAGD